MGSEWTTEDANTIEGYLSLENLRKVTSLKIVNDREDKNSRLIAALGRQSSGPRYG